ncbi:MAG: lasso RiPP family leader peptide-containing protein [Solirubrobacteraceae bacterium]|nr:lasso RiPP family leader peptide-containing protein [Solirubrobacteraceae bacterium]
MPSTYERPTLTDIGTVEDLTQGTIKIKSNFAGVDVHFNKDKIIIKPGKAGVKFTS